MSMDPWLAKVYGTAGGEAATDLEKTAQAMFLQKLAAQENIDLSQLSPEQQEALVQQILAAGQQPTAPQGQPQPQGQPPMQAAPQGQPQPQGDPSMDPAQVQELMMKEAQAKFEEADFLGRAMAHAYVNELEKIAEEGKLPAFMQGGGTDKSSKTGAEPSKTEKEKSKSDKTEKTKTAALIEKLAEARAAEILVANGINPETGEPLEAQPQQPAAPQGDTPAPDAEQQVQAVVDQKAVEMLKAAGYQFEQ